MKIHRIGQTYVAATDISFGCASVGNLYRKVEDDDAQKVLTTACSTGSAISTVRRITDAACRNSV